MNDDTLVTLFEKVEKLRNMCFGVSAQPLDIMVTGDNHLMMNTGNVMYHTVLEDITFPHKEIAFRNAGPIEFDDHGQLIAGKSIQMLDFRYLAYCVDIYKYVTIRNVLRIVAQDDNLSDNPSFQDMMNIKAADGLKYFYLMNNANNQMMQVPYFVGLYKINKKDKFGIKIYDYDDTNYLVNMIDQKSKIQPIDIIFKMLKTS